MNISTEVHPNIRVPGSVKIAGALCAMWGVVGIVRGLMEMHGFEDQGISEIAMFFLLDFVKLSTGIYILFGYGKERVFVCGLLVYELLILPAVVIAAALRAFSGPPQSGAIVLDYPQLGPVVLSFVLSRLEDFFIVPPILGLLSTTSARSFVKAKQDERRRIANNLKEEKDLHPEKALYTVGLQNVSYTTYRAIMLVILTVIAIALVIAISAVPKLV